MPYPRRTLLLLPLAAVASLLIANLGCSALVGLPATPTPTMPLVMCTAPACQPNESYYCPGSCPGGCGTTCATNTPGPTPTDHCLPGAFFLPEGDTFKCMTPTPPTPYVTLTPAKVSCPPGELYLPVDGIFKCVTPTAWTLTPWAPTPLANVPQIQCTPPACRPGEVYYCPGQCPGGCGTTCVTPTAWAPTAWTPTPAGLTPMALAATACLIVTRTPPPSAPTAVADGTALPGRRVDPHVEVCVSATTVNVGQRVTLVGQVVDIGLPYFYLMMRPAGVGDFQPWLTVTYNNEVKAQTDNGGPLEVVSARGDMQQLVVVLHGRSAGAVDVVVNATGEVHYGYPGPATWAGGGSDPLTIVVQK